MLRERLTPIPQRAESNIYEPEYLDRLCARNLGGLRLFGNWTPTGKGGSYNRSALTARIDAARWAA